MTASEKVLDTTGIDFVNVHHYGAVAHLRTILKYMDRRFEGKSFSLGEFGSRTAHTARTSGDWGDPAEESVRHYLAVGHYALGMGASFIANWSWKDFRDSVFPWGINHADLTPKPVMEAYRNMMLLFRPVRLRYEEPKLYLILPDSLRLGADNKGIHEALRRSIDYLIMANVPFGVITEDSLDRLPYSAEALIWPLAYCPADAVFEHVTRFVDRGGHLLISGDPRFDESRHPFRLQRLKALGFADDATAPLPPSKDMPLPENIPFIISANRRVCRVPLALELRDNDGQYTPGIYRRFIDEISGVSRIKVVPDDGSVSVFDVAVQEGRMLVALNMADKHQDVSISAHNGYPAVNAGIDAGRTLTLMWNKQGAVTVVAAQGSLSVDGKPILPNNGDCAFLSLDNRDLRSSDQIMALPFGVGRFALQRVEGAGKLEGEKGEFSKGHWVVLEKQLLKGDGSVVSGEIDAATAYDIRLLATPENQVKARESAQRLLLFQGL
ncbi:MAG: hypothetical protein PF904_19920 [Kiritimatiellae bacterium]|nr:hypothetical protein [Kiritimatiellia bacterium]